MKGFIKNEGEEVAFKLQKHIIQGGVVDLDYAYKLVGAVSGHKQDVSFVKWLRDTYFPESFWGFYKEDGTAIPLGKRKEAAVVTAGKGAGTIFKRTNYDAKGEVITADLIISKPIAQAKVLIEKCKERAVLRKALTLSRHFSGKEEYMRAILKRIDQVY